MVAIADKFGKASKSTEYAPATTVKTARLPGITVLEAYDLSKYPTDTPLFFITYKKTIDPLDPEKVLITNQVSWKALVNDVSNTLTNLTVAPGYTDLGNDVGDFIESIPTSYWETSLIDAILVHANPDGTLKPDAVKAALNLSSTSPDWTPLANTPSTVVANGNRSYTLTIPGINYTDRLSAGMRLKTQRTTAASTQSTSLNGTTQYWVKTSPNKLTFTDDFVVSAWVKLTSYPSSPVFIASRTNGTSGWQLQVNAAGKVALIGINSGGGNVSYVESYQSLPLNKWVHIAAQLDMSSFTATTTTSYVMFDGVDIPVSVSRAGTNPTSLIQAGNLEIGSANGSGFFPGKIAQVAIYNAKVTQATILASISQGLSGSETSLASAYSFNGVTTDLNTTTPNDLVAGAGSPTATNADSPFGGQASGTISSTLDYGIVQSATFSTNTTVVVQVPEGCTIPTNSGGVNAVSYSSAKAPYGMPTDTSKHSITSLYNTAVSITSGGFSTWQVLNNVTVNSPVGKWNGKLSGSAYQNNSSSGGASFRTTFAPTASGATGYGADIYANKTENNYASIGDVIGPVNTSVPISITTQGQTSLYMRVDGGAGTVTLGIKNLVMILDNAYL